MSEPRLPLLDRVLIRAFLWGPEAEFVIGDLVERYHAELHEGVGARVARRRLRRRVLGSCFAWWCRSARGPVSTTRGSRDAGRGASVSSLRRGGSAGWPGEIGLALRSLRRRPLFSIGVASTLALGIGATTTIFTVVDGVLLRPLAFDDPDRLVAVGTVFPGREWADEGAGLQHLAGVSVLNVMDIRARARSFEAIAAVEAASSILLPDRGEGPELVGAASVSSDFFALLGVAPALGRTFLADEYSVSSTQTFMLSHGAWQRRYGGDPDVVGRPVDRVGTDAVIVGVLPADFRPPEAIFRSTPDFWMPLQPDHPRYGSRGSRSVSVLARLRPGVTVDDARAEGVVLAAALAEEFPDGNVYPNGTYFGVGVNGLHAETVGSTGTALRVFLAAAALLLVLAALNAATLQLARSLDRVAELGVRVALGAGRGRVVGLLLVDGLVLSIAGGLLGVALAYGGVELFLRYAPSSIPRLDQVAVDLRILGVAAAISVLAGTVVGSLPALRLTRGGSWHALAGSGRGRIESASRWRALLVGGQVTIAVLLLSGAGLLFNSFVRIVGTETGFRPEGLVSMNIGLKRPDAPPDEEMWRAWDGALDELRTVAGVEAVAGTSNPPFQSPFWGPRILLPDDPADTWRDGIAGYSVTPGYFDVLGARVMDGRDFNSLDRADTERVAIVNEAFVRLWLDGGDAVDLVVRHAADEREPEPMRIVGVVGDMVQGRAEEGARPAIYMPYTQSEWPFVQAVVRLRAAPDEVLPELREAVARFNPVVPPRDVRTMDDRISDTRTTPRFQTLLIGAFASISVLLAALGLFGALSHAVGRRRREMGVRMALGAGRRSVRTLVLRQGMAIVGVGLALGIGAALVSNRLLTGFLYEVEPGDPVTLGVVTLLLLAVSATACIVPAVRATSVDPVEVLRSE